MKKYEKKENASPIEKILDCSYGKLVYHFQFEVLYKLITDSNDLEKAIYFRQEFNKKNYLITTPLLEKKLSNGQTVCDFIDQHRICDFVFRPQWEAAGKLMELLILLGKIMPN